MMQEIGQPFLYVKLNESRVICFSFLSRGCKPGVNPRLPMAIWGFGLARFAEAVDFPLDHKKLNFMQRGRQPSSGKSAADS